MIAIFTRVVSNILSPPDEHIVVHSTLLRSCDVNVTGSSSLTGCVSCCLQTVTPPVAPAWGLWPPTVCAASSLRKACSLSQHSCSTACARRDAAPAASWMTRRRAEVSVSWFSPASFFPFLFCSLCLQNPVGTCEYKHSTNLLTKHT